MTAELTYLDQGQAVLDGVAALVRHGVLSHSGHMNFSVRLDDQRMLLTAKPGTPELRHEDLAVVRLDGTVESGNLDPTNREIIMMHAIVYQLRPDWNAVVHTHSPAITAFALAHQPLPCRYEALLRWGQAEPVPVVPWGPRGSDVSVRGIAAALDQQPDTRAVLLANHGLLAFGDSAALAAQMVTILEETAGMELAAATLGGAKEFPPGALDAVRQSMARARS